MPPISLALSIAVGVIIASYVIYDQSNDRKAITINLLTEAVGIVVGGIVVALIFQLMLESRSEKRWSTARVAILQQLESHYRAIIYVARDQWRWGYRLPPLPDNAQLEESLKVFRDQLENARFEKYKWYDNHGSHIYPISDAIDDFWRACNVVREISEKMLPVARACLPAAAGAGDDDLVKVLVAWIKLEDVVLYSELFPNPKSKHSAAELFRSDIIEFMDKNTALLSLFKEHVGTPYNPFDESDYREKRTEFEQAGIDIG